MTGRRPRGLPATELLRRCRPSEVPAADRAAPGPQIPQPRVLETLQVAAASGAEQLHVIATGAPGTGRRAALEAWLRERAQGEPTPPDVVYLPSFRQPLCPRNYRLASGSAPAFGADVARLVDDARRRIIEAFESEGYRARHRELQDELDRRRTAVLRDIEQRAHAKGVALQLTPGGVMTLPIVGGRPIAPDEMEAMPDVLRERFERAVDELKAPVQEGFARIHEIERELQNRHAELDREVAIFATGRLFDEVRARWADGDEDGVAEWLDEMREDAIAHLDQLRAPPEVEELPPMLRGMAPRADLRARYAVNVLVTHEPGQGAPVVVPTDTSFYELFGRAEYETEFGSARTDHRHLRAGAVHRAAGGYLVLDAADILSKPAVWPRLKDVLRTGRAKIENLAVQYMLFPGVTLDPEPMAVRTMVVLIASTELYELLHALDEDVARLFKLRADFQPDMPRDGTGIASYAGLVRALEADRGLPAFDRDAVAALVEHGSRLAGNRERLSTRVRQLTDIAVEAAQEATRVGAARVGREQIRSALAARRRRADRPEQRLREITLDGTMRIALEGAVVGQVNGLAVSVAGEHSFGHPIRLSATAAAGDGAVVDIDREVELSGPIHDKGFLILSGLLASRYARDTPLSLRGSIVAEQSYGGIEGDSATVAELLALLSAIGEFPLDQSVALTGSLDQHGNVQAVGGVNEKIEGFFALCRDAGLTGGQGVVLPRANLRHLMLDEEVVDAVRARQFRIWPVDSCDAALELVTGRRAGT
ncbi:MAG TPA: ATP-binding protein, partial [Solirubrobacteraceae bacterium]|nr:ATP-binding protein [Solirubrobacteraceae bacterium]